MRELVRRRECDFTDPDPHPPAGRPHRRDGGGRRGDPDTAVRLSCGRCLAEFIGPLATDFALTYAREAPAEAGRRAEPETHEVEAEEAGLIYFRGEEIDLTDGIQEQVILALPLRPLCREDCKGLCAACGADLNQGDLPAAVRSRRPAAPLPSLARFETGSKD
ncbi:MAG: DUF177 domain-containing protein [Desulfomicrobium escambiense]|nr:DUF177 domain-containing protein [Desulfomicrobium escambiense]